MSQAIIRDWRQIKGRNPHEKILVEIPGKWAGPVMALIRLSNEHREQGLLVTNVGPNGQAKRAGMARGDILLRFNGVELDSVRTLQTLCRDRAATVNEHRSVKVEALRRTNEIEFELAGGDLGVTVSAMLHRLNAVKLRQEQLVAPLRVRGVRWTPT